MFAIAITLLVLDLAIPDSGSPLERVLDAWPFYLAYVVSFLTIGAAWLAHLSITSRLTRADSILLRLNLVLLMVTSVLPFPTRLVAESLDDVSGERVFVTMYGLTLLAIRVLLYALDMYCQREHLYSPPESEAAEPAEPAEPSEPAGSALLPVLGAYGTAILIGLVSPWLAVSLYCLIAVVLVVQFGELRRLLFHRA